MRRLELYKYNPDQYSQKEMEDTFVAREAILQSILDELRERSKSPTNQHFLITGPRGIGKSNLLVMIKNRILSESSLSQGYVPVKTSEEEYSIYCLRDLFSRILELLFDISQDKDLKDAISRIQYNSDDDHAVEIAYNSLRDYCAHSDKKLVLLIDNFDLILGDQISDVAQIGKLRDILMNQSFLVLIGASPSFFKEVSGYTRPFYEFFHIVDLDELSVEQMTELIHKRAECDGNTALTQNMDDLVSRIKVVHHLTGGNPRLALMLYQICSTREFHEVKTALRELLDDLTPYYKARLEQLPPQPRKVMNTFASLGRPATPKELSNLTRIPINQINSILIRLKDPGFVAIAPQKRRKSTLYMVSDRVFRVWHQMRYSQKSRRRLEFLIEFLRIWYSEKEWKSEIQRLLEEYKSLSIEKRFEDASPLIEHLGYLFESSPKPEMKYEVEDDFIRTCIESGDYSHAEEILQERMEKYTQENNKDRLAETWFYLSRLNSSQGKILEAISYLEKVISLKPSLNQSLNNWRMFLLSLFYIKKDDDERDQLLKFAFEQFNIIFSCVSIFRLEEEKIYGINLVGLILYLYFHSIINKNIDLALKLYGDLLDQHKLLGKEDYSEIVVNLFESIVEEQNIEICEQMLNMIKDRNLMDIYELLTPFAKAIEFWKEKDENKRAEILDTLNPELREIVEAIIHPKDKVIEANKANIGEV